MNSRSSSTPTPSDPLEDRIRALKDYDDDDDDPSVTGNHNVVAMPGSHVHIGGEADSQNPPKWLAPKWAKIGASIVGALAGAGMLAKAIYEAIK